MHCESHVENQWCKMGEEQENITQKQEIPVTETKQETNDSNKTEGGPPEVNQNSDQEVKDEKIELTKTELDAREAGIRKVAEKRAYRKFQEEMQRNASQYGTPSAVDANNGYWDPSLNRYIPRNMTIEEYGKLLDGQQTPNQQIAPNQQSSNQKLQPVTPPMREEGLTESAELQVTTLMAKNPAVKDALLSVPITDTMVNAAAIDPNGINNLWEAIKERPHEIYRICQLSPMEQQAKMWELNQSVAANKAPKVQTKATPQVPPLADGENVKKWSEMSYLERKAALQKEDRRKYPGAK